MGPVRPHSIRGPKGLVDVAPLQWRIIKEMWHAPKTDDVRIMPIPELQTRAWKSNQPVSDSAFKTAIFRANEYLEEANLSATITQKGGFALLT